VKWVKGCILDIKQPDHSKSALTSIFDITDHVDFEKID